VGSADEEALVEVMAVAMEVEEVLEVVSEEDMAAEEVMEAVEDIRMLSIRIFASFIHLLHCGSMFSFIS